MRFRLARNGEKRVLADTKTGLQLICDSTRSDNLQVAFWDGFCYITGRDIGEHPPAFSSMLDAPFQYLSFGGGLDEGAPMIAAYRPGFPKPVVIDPAPFPAIAEMCDKARQYDELSRYYRIDDFAQRCSILLDSRRVRLINTSLCRVDLEKEGLLCFADFAIDLCGPRHYAEYGKAKEIPAALRAECAMRYDLGATPEEISALERRLVKPGGRLFEAACTGWDIEYRVYFSDELPAQRK